MEYRPYLGDDRLIHKIVYDSNIQSDCIYCGLPADSREHIPSKVFLKKPYPRNLYIVPACKKCNNLYSDDELYSWFIIKILEQMAHSNVENSVDDERRFFRHASIAKIVRTDIAAFVDSNIHTCRLDSAVFDFRSNRLERTLEKLAIGHSVFELSEGYRSDETEGWITEKIAYGFAPALSEDTKSDFDCAIPINQILWPEVGSRIYDHIFVVQVPLISTSNPLDCREAGIVFLDWIDVQEATYRYITINTNDQIYVHIVIDEFLYSSIVFRKMI